MAEDLSGIVESTQPERLATGFVFTEGPVWHPDGYLLFVDLHRNLIFRLAPCGQPEVVRANSGRSNGLALDLQRRLIMCESDNGRVTRMADDGSITPVADRWEGKRLKGPNDVVCRSDGSIYFTNPGGNLEPSVRAIGISGVHRVTPDGTLSVVISDMEYPNGLAFSPDEGSSTCPTAERPCMWPLSMCGPTDPWPTVESSPTCTRTSPMGFQTA